MTNYLPLTGYAEQLSARPGESVEFKVSSQFNSPYAVTLVKVVCADPNVDGPGLLEQDIDVDVGGPYPSRNQPFYPGSYALADLKGLLADEKQLLITALMQPSCGALGNHAIFSLGSGAEGMSLCWDKSGDLILSAGAEHEQLRLSADIKKGQWYRVSAWFDIAEQTMEICCEEMASEKQTIVKSAAIRLNAFALWDTFVVGGNLSLTDDSGHPLIKDHFNGKIEAPAIFRNASACNDRTLLAKWDFSEEISSTKIVDVGPHQLHGDIHNFPTRAVTGYWWDGTEMNWRHRPHHYGAIHFHQDDIYDFGWKADFTFEVPESLPSGAYAMRLDCEDCTDWIPFFVCPQKNQPKSKLCILVSTFTYAIYGNHSRPDYQPEWKQLNADKGGYPWNPAEFEHYGLSTYNTHVDGSGICHASHKRPLLNMRPGYITYPHLHCSGLRHYQADSHLLYWLEHQGIDYDLITDQQLHEEGTELLKQYTTVCTGTHPEYHSSEMLDAIAAYRKVGNFIYLGGNGFYWRIAVHEEQQGLLEIRRGEGGIRAWAAEPGEYYQSFNGQYGGLWRRNRRAPQQIAGVGFSAQGNFFGSYYRRNPMLDQYPDSAWIFEGIEDEKLGDFGLSGGGAAGFELDRYDPELGSEDNTVILASSENHHASFVLVPEERLTHITNWSGVSDQDLIRADMIYQRSDEGAQLFSTGSITFCGSLLHNNCDNNISKLLNNIVLRFTAT